MLPLAYEMDRADRIRACFGKRKKIYERSLSMLQDIFKILPGTQKRNVAGAFIGDKPIFKRFDKHEIFGYIRILAGE